MEDSHGVKKLAKLLFRLYDVDSSGSLSEADVAAFVRVLKPDSEWHELCGTIIEAKPGGWHRVEFDDAVPDNLRQPQIRLKAFDRDRLEAVARKVRQVYPSERPLDKVVNDKVIDTLCDAMTSGFGGRIEVIPRLFLRSWVDLLDRADQHSDFDPLDFLQKKGLTPFTPEELTDEEREHWDSAHEIEF